MSRPQGSEPGQWADGPGTDQSAGGALSWQPSGSNLQYGQSYGAPNYGQAGYGQPQTGYPQAPTGYGQPQTGAYPAGSTYGQPIGQYPAVGQPGQYPGFGQPPALAPGKKSGRTVGILLAVLGAVVVAAVLVTGFWKPGFFITTKLDVNKVQDGVKQVLTDGSTGYGAKDVKDVKCNNGQNPTVKKGGTFTCEVSVEGTKRQVTVTMQDDKGTYEVGRPK